MSIFQQLSAIGFGLQYETVFVAHPADQSLTNPNSHLRIELPEVADDRDW